MRESGPAAACSTPCAAATPSTAFRASSKSRFRNSRPGTASTSIIKSEPDSIWSCTSNRTGSKDNQMGFLSAKRALIVGLATDRSIAWGIAQAMHREGAELAFAHIERMTDRVVPLAKQLGSDLTFVMDVGSDEEISKGFAH